MNIETPLAAIAIAIGIAALIISWRRPSEMEKIFRNRIEQLSADLQEAKRHSAVLEQRIQDTEKRMVSLVNENLRLQQVVAWLRIQLREHGVEIAKLPDYLKEPTDAAGLLIQLNQAGVSIAGDVSAQDVVGGDKNLKP